LTALPGAPLGRLLLLVATALGFAGPVGAEGQSRPPLERVDPEPVGVSTRGLERATEELRARIDAGDIPGVVAAVVRDGKLAYSEALGYRDVETRSPMALDALFRVYSMTRPVTALAILMLQDDGLLDVHDPVQKYLPRFAVQGVLLDPESPDPAAAARPRKGDITLVQPASDPPR